MILLLLLHLLLLSTNNNLCSAFKTNVKSHKEAQNPPKCNLKNNFKKTKCMIKHNNEFKIKSQSARQNPKNKYIQGNKHKSKTLMNLNKMSTFIKKRKELKCDMKTEHRQPDLIGA